MSLRLRTRRARNISQEYSARSIHGGFSAQRPTHLATLSSKPWTCRGCEFKVMRERQSRRTKKIVGLTRKRELWILARAWTSRVSSSNYRVRYNFSGNDSRRSRRCFWCVYVYIYIYICFANDRLCRDNASDRFRSDGLQRRWKRSHSVAIVTAHCPLLGKSSYDLLRATDPTEAVLRDVSK